VLVRHVLDEARERGLAVLPLCPFVRGWISRHEDYLDLVPPTARTKYGLA
jgi:predicted GNAT family acetyltransferase